MISADKDSTCSLVSSLLYSIIENNGIANNISYFSGVSDSLLFSNVKVVPAPPKLSFANCI